MEDSKWTEYAQVNIRGSFFAHSLIWYLLYVVDILTIAWLHALVLCLSYNILFCVFHESAEITELAEHGITLPPNMQGLTEEQIVELKLRDEWKDKCMPSEGPVFKKDEIGRRNGHGKIC